jgi:hypothetical protein
VITYALCAGVALTVLGLRRKFIGGEFGGNLLARNCSSCCFFFLWLIYCLVSTYVALTEDGREPNIVIHGTRVRVPNMDPILLANQARAKIGL